MKILLVCERLEGKGGWYTYTNDLAEGLKANGHDVVVHEMPVSPLKCMSFPPRLLFAAGKLKRIVNKEKPDVIHITVEPYAMVTSFLPKEIIEKCVLTIHGSYGIRPLEKSLTNKFATKYYNAINFFITVSSYTRTAVTDALELYIDKPTAQHFHESAMVIHNGIQLPSEKFQNPESRNQKSILLVGGVKPRKGVLEAIDACAKYRDQYGDDFHFKIVGTKHEKSSYTKKVLDRIEELKLSDNIELTGQLSDQELAEAYQQADLYLMPALTTENTFEGFGLAYLEANAYGVPCIGPNDSGAAEAIEDGATGYSVDPHDADTIAQRMHWILDKKKIKAENCRDWAEQHSRENMAKEVESLYELIHSSV